MQLTHEKNVKDGVYCWHCTLFGLESKKKKKGNKKHLAPIKAHKKWRKAGEAYLVTQEQFCLCTAATHTDLQVIRFSFNLIYHIKIVYYFHK